MIHIDCPRTLAGLRECCEKIIIKWLLRVVLSVYKTEYIILMFLSVCRVVSLWCGIIMVQYIFNRLLPVFLVYLSSPGNGKGLLSSIEHRPFSEDRRIEMREHARRMFYFGYDNYLQYAFPKDELNPIYCTGRGHDWDNP